MLKYNEFKVIERKSIDLQASFSRNVRIRASMLTLKLCW
jgi:hypothetical protein